MTSGAPPYQIRVRRLVGLLIAGLVIEGALLAITRLSPAFAVIMRPVYAIVAAAFGLAIWHAARRRDERRQGDRRGSAAGK
jgi:hypothetical protein